MRNAIARLALLAASIIALGGCDSRVQTHQRSRAAAAVSEPNVRYQVDAAHGRIWWLTREGVFLHNAETPQRRAVPIPGWQWADVAYACLPALALGPKGEALVTSNVLPTVWKIDPETLAVSEHALALDADQDKDVGFSGLAYSSEHGAFFAVSELHGSLWRIDPDLTRAQKIAVRAPMRTACGLAVRTTQKASGVSSLCVRGRDGDWTVYLEADRPSAYVRAAPCTDLPWLLGQVALRRE